MLTVTFSLVTLLEAILILNLFGRYVVPYNRNMLVKYNAHLNLEWCNRGLAIKYLFKYINKGVDMTTIVINKTIRDSNDGTVNSIVTPDEIVRYLECR